LALLGGKVLPEASFLAGGSALALHFGHRISIDFDFFCDRPFSSEKLAETLKKIGDFKPQTILKDTLLGTFNNIKFSIFLYQYPWLFPGLNFQGVRLADPKDIGAMKIAAVMDRGSKKDFIDLYFLDKKGVGLEKCLEYYDRKYKSLANNLYSILTSLSYFVDAEASQMPRMIEKVSWEEVKAFFEKEAVRLGKKYLEK